MDLLLKVIIAALIIGLVIGAGYLLLKGIEVGQITQQQAAALVLNDLNTNNYGAIINITNVTPSTYSGSWHIIASIVTNATSPCPNYETLSFDYPAFHFQNTSGIIYTSGCVIHGLEQNKSYIIGSYPVAIVRSYNLQLPIITNFVSLFGYSNIRVHATFYPTLNYSNQTKFNDVWLVNYSAPGTGYYEYVILSQVGGNPLLNYTVTH